MASEVLYGERPHSLLVQPGAEGMPQDMGTSLTLVDAGQLQVSSHYTVRIVVRLKAKLSSTVIDILARGAKQFFRNGSKIGEKGIDRYTKYW